MDMRRYAIPGALACALLLSACTSEGSSPETPPEMTLRTSESSPEADVQSARAACNTAIIRRWPRAIDPSMFAFNTTGSGDISAGDEYGQEVADCIQTAVINRNATGGR